MKEYLGLVSSPRFRCKYRALPNNFKKGYQRGAMLAKILLSKDASNPKVKELNDRLMNFAKGLLTLRINTQRAVNEILNGIESEIGNL